MCCLMKVELLKKSHTRGKTFYSQKNLVSTEIFDKK